MACAATLSCCNERRRQACEAWNLHGLEVLDARKNAREGATPDSAPSDTRTIGARQRASAGHGSEILLRDRPARIRATHPASGGRAATAPGEEPRASFRLQPVCKTYGHRAERDVRLPCRRETCRRRRVELAPAPA